MVRGDVFAARSALWQMLRERACGLMNLSLI
jgi:hypothetical protein